MKNFLLISDNLSLCFSRNKRPPFVWGGCLFQFDKKRLFSIMLEKLCFIESHNRISDTC